MFMQGADVVIHDAQYTPEEYPQKKNWGHATYDYVVQVAAAAGVRKLYLTHHDPLHDDEFVAAIEKKARDVARHAGSPMEVYCAAEGYEETVQPRESGARISGAQQTSSIESEGLRVLIVDDDEDLRVLAGVTLRRNGHAVIEASGGAEALAMIEDNKPDLVVLDLLMPPPDGIEVLRRLRSDPRTATVPVLVLTAMGDESNTRMSFDMGATDFLSKPFTPPQLDARVRTCFARAGSAAK